MAQKREYSRASLAMNANVNMETIRYFEKIGLMPNPPRTRAGYRTYSTDHLRRLKFIRRSKELGFTNSEVSALLNMVDGTYVCDDVKEIALSHTSLITEKIKDLAKMKDALEDMAAKCSGGNTPNCAIVEKLFAQ